MIHTAKQLKDKVKNMSGGNSEVAQALIRTYFMERFLERVSVSEYRNNFILKGGMLVASIVGVDMRVTMDIDGIDMNAKGHHSKLIDEIPDSDIAISMGCDVGCPFIDRPFDDDWGLRDPTGKSDEDFIEVIKEIEDKIIQLKNSL